LDSILRATVTPIRVGYGATTAQYCVQDSFAVRSKLDMKSSQKVMKQRCRDLGLFVYGDKQALLARIVNEENRLTTDRQVKDSDTDQEMLCTFKGTASLPIMDNMPCQHRQAEITAETKGDFERCSELMQWYKNHSGECPRRKSDDNTEASLARWLDKARSRRARAHDNSLSGRKLTTKETARLNSILTLQKKTIRVYKSKTDLERCNELRQWCLSHSGQLPTYRRSLRKWYLSHPGVRPRRRSDDKKQNALAIWLGCARIRRARAINKWPSGRQLTAKETAQLNSILASASKSRTTATDLNLVPEGTQQPET
jgi:hypothetical protein